MTSGALQNFLRRWSTTDITTENALLFDEHKMGVLTVLSSDEQALVRSLTSATPRSVFAAHYANILKDQRTEEKE
jgi:hypothetical protein